MRDGALQDWKVKSFKGHWSGSKLKDIMYSLTTYIEDNNVSSIILKKPDVFRTSDGLEYLISDLKTFCLQRHIKIVLISLKTLKEHYSKEKGFTKTKLIRHIAKQNPELYGEYNKEQRNRNSYYIKMFEAIALVNFFSDYI